MDTRRDTDTYLEHILNCLACMVSVVGWAVALAVLFIAAREFLGSIPEVQEFFWWLRG